MPVNKGLLLGAAFANGMNAFMDAREKGDLQRQRVALAQIEKQMKVAQLENLRTTGLMQGAKYDQFMATDPHVRAGAEYDAATAKWGSKTKEQEHLQSLVKTDVDIGTQGPLIDLATQKALEQTAATDLKQTEARHAKWVATIQQLGLGGTPENELVPKVLGIMEKGTPQQQAIIRNTLGITSKAELAELPDTQSRKESEQVISTGVAQEQYAKARELLANSQKTTQVSVRDYYKARIDNLERISASDFKLLRELGVPAERFPESGLYKDLDLTTLADLELRREKTYRYFEIVSPDGSKQIAAIDTSTNMATMVTVKQPPVPAGGQVEGEYGVPLSSEQKAGERSEDRAEVGLDQALKAEVDSWAEEADSHVLSWKSEEKREPDFRLENTLREGFKRNQFVAAWNEVDMLYDEAVAAHGISLEGGLKTFVDQALINIFNKMLDYKSVVREGEYARTEAQTSFLNRIVALTLRVTDGGSLAPADRLACMEMVGEFYRLHKERYLVARNGMKLTVRSMNERAGWVMFDEEAVLGYMPEPEERIILGSSKPGWKRSSAGAAPQQPSGDIDMGQELDDMGLPKDPSRRKRVN